MKIIALVFSLLILTVGYSKPENKEKSGFVTITGKVVDSSEGLVGVKIMLDNKEVDVYTDFDGNFTIERVPNGEHSLSFALVTYATKEIKVNTSNVTDLSVRLYGK